VRGIRGRVAASAGARFSFAPFTFASSASRGGGRCPIAPSPALRAAIESCPHSDTALLGQRRSACAIAAATPQTWKVSALARPNRRSDRFAKVFALPSSLPTTARCSLITGPFRLPNGAFGTPLRRGGGGALIRRSGSSGATTRGGRRLPLPTRSGTGRRDASRLRRHLLRW